MDILNKLLRGAIEKIYPRFVDYSQHEQHDNLTKVIGYLTWLFKEIDQYIGKLPKPINDPTLRGLINQWDRKRPLFLDIIHRHNGSFLSPSNVSITAIRNGLKEIHEEVSTQDLQTLGVLPFLPKSEENQPDPEEPILKTWLQLISQAAMLQCVLIHAMETHQNNIMAPCGVTEGMEDT